MTQKTRHDETLTALRRIEGHVKGIQKMVEEGKYCVDIVIQIHAVVSALYRVSEKIFAKHIESCVASAFRGKPKKEKDAKIEEIIHVVHNLHALR